MNWGSWENFWHMGGYAPFVWGSYAVTFACIALELWLLARGKRTLRARLAQMLGIHRKTSDET